MSRTLKVFLLGFTTLLIIFAGILVFNYNPSKNHTPTNDDYYLYQGKEYAYNDDLTTILIFGVDKDNEYVKENEEASHLKNYEQADFLVLAVIDRKTQDADFIQINRDTMVNMDLKSETGATFNDGRIQLALTHTYGSGGSDSAVNLINAVVKSFNNLIRIDHYLKVTYSAVPILNDLLGGITLEVLDDMSMYDSELYQGNVLNLTGEQAHTYVRSRMELEDPTNEARVRRQSQYIEAYIDKYQKTDIEITDKQKLELANQIYSDLSINVIQTLFENMKPSKVSLTYIEGENKMGEKFIEFTPDKNKLEDVTIKTFYKKV